MHVYMYEFVYVFFIIIPSMFVSCLLDQEQSDSIFHLMYVLIVITSNAYINYS